jgi:hypothetical protein
MKIHTRLHVRTRCAGLAKPKDPVFTITTLRRAGYGVGRRGSDQEPQELSGVMILSRICAPKSLCTADLFFHINVKQLFRRFCSHPIPGFPEVPASALAVSDLIALPRALEVFMRKGKRKHRQRETLAKERMR